MAILTDPPEWRVPGTKPPRNIIEELGWEVASYPPAPWFNWFFHRVFESLLELESAMLARVVNEAGVPSIMAGPESERPAASQETVGRIYIATDTKRMFRDRGDGWELLNAPDAIGAETPAGAQAKAEAAASAALSGAQAYADQAVAAHAGRTDNPHQVTAAQLGLGDVLTNLDQILGSRIVDHNLDVGGSNGYYVRFENGWQVCWNVLEGTRTTSTVTGSLYRDDAATTWTFPAAFIASPTVYGTVLRADDDGRYLFFAPYGVTTTSVTYRDVATGGGMMGRNDQLLALGRWK